MSFTLTDMQIVSIYLVGMVFGAMMYDEDRERFAHVVLIIVFICAVFAVLRAAGV